MDFSFRLETEMLAYGQDLAYIHDVGHTDFARRVAPEVLRLLSDYIAPGGLVVDLGCGSGVWARELTAAGHEVLGVDISPAMIALAKRKAPKARFITGSLLQVPLPPCDAVTSLGECVNYAFDGSNTRQALARLFLRVQQALRPGGIFVFDVVEAGAAKNMPRRDYRTGEDWAVMREVEEDEGGRSLVRRITSFRKSGNAYRRSEEVHQLRLYTRAELRADLAGAGFIVRVMRSYGRFWLGPGRAVFLAEKSRRRAPRHAARYAALQEE